MILPTDYRVLGVSQKTIDIYLASLNSSASDYKIELKAGKKGIYKISDTDTNEEIAYIKRTDKSKVPFDTGKIDSKYFDLQQRLLENGVYDKRTRFSIQSANRHYFLHALMPALPIPKETKISSAVQLLFEHLWFDYKPFRHFVGEKRGKIYQIDNLEQQVIDIKNKVLDIINDPIYDNIRKLDNVWELEVGHDLNFTFNYGLSFDDPKNLVVHDLHTFAWYYDNIVCIPYTLRQ